MIRLLILLAIAIWLLMVAGRWILRLLAPFRDARRAFQQAYEQSNGPTQTAGPTTVERLIPCAVCGTRIPASRALRLPSLNGAYCSPACRDAAATSMHAAS